MEASAAPDCALPMSARTAAAADPAAGVSLEDRTLQTRKTYPCVRASSAREDTESDVSPTSGISEFTNSLCHLNLFADVGLVVGGSSERAAARGAPLAAGQTN